MISRSARPGHSRDTATVAPVARAITVRAERLMISVDMRLR
jgi:cob(I)alamin adenosyltransferase